MLRAFLIALALLIVSTTAHAGPSRSVAVVSKAIARVAPKMGKQARTSYAKLIKAAADKHDIDPLTLVALAWHESDFRPGLISPDGHDHGLFQIRVGVQKACKSGDAAACSRARACALNAVCSIRRIASIINQTRKLCRRKTKRTLLFPGLLAMLGGRNHPRLPGVWCGRQKGKAIKRHRGEREVIACRRSLIRGRRCVRERR